MRTGGFVTTHVLDTARGVPAAGIQIDAYRIVEAEGKESRVRIATATTNADGRTDAPIIATEAMAEAVFELIFHAGDYLRQTANPGQAAGDDRVPFLGSIPIRFGVSDAGQHYHVPLLLSPFGYSTYRGS